MSLACLFVVLVCNITGVPGHARIPSRNAAREHRLLIAKSESLERTPGIKFIFECLDASEAKDDSGNDRKPVDDS